MFYFVNFAFIKTCESDKQGKKLPPLVITTVSSDPALPDNFKIKQVLFPPIFPAI